MTTYKDIRGTHITTVTTDPPAPVNGQMWYNSTTQVMKGFTSNPVGSFASGGNMNSARKQLAGFGSQTSAIVAGGNTAYPGTSVVNSTENYNGSSWTEVNNLNSARNGLTGAGSNSTAGIAYGGDNPSTGKTESWNGTSFSEVNDLNTSRYVFAGNGTSTSALASGGYSTAITDITESWNGSSWTEVNDLNTARFGLGGAGADNTSALVFGGQTPGGTVTNSESWNGSSWTEVNDLNTDRMYAKGAFGTATSAVMAGGLDVPPETIYANTEHYNGTSWSETTDIPTASNRGSNGVTGSFPSGLVSGGEIATGNTAATFEWTSPTTNTVTFTVS